MGVRVSEGREAGRACVRRHRARLAGEQRPVSSAARRRAPPPPSAACASAHAARRLLCHSRVALTRVVVLYDGTA